LDNVPLPNPDTIQEFKTQTSLYDASSGRNGGGNVQVNLKSGTAHYHGDAYEFFRNNVLNANDFSSTRQRRRSLGRFCGRISTAALSADLCRNLRTFFSS